MVPGLDFWADYFRTMFVPQIDAWADSLSTRVLPAFGNLAEEAKRIELEEYRRLCSLPGGYGDDLDLGSLAEQAQEDAIDYYTTMESVVQGVVNLFGVGLWHLLEQQLAHFARKGLPYSFDPPIRPSRTSRAPSWPWA